MTPAASAAFSLYVPSPVISSVPQTGFSPDGVRKSTMSTRPCGKWKVSSLMVSSMAVRSTYVTPGTRNAVLRSFARTPSTSSAAPDSKYRASYQ